MLETAPIQVLVNNAGLHDDAVMPGMQPAQWQRVIDVNLTGVFAGCRRAIDHFLDRKMPGVIINLSSVHEIIPWPHFADYAASKAGVGMLTKTLALEYADRGIRVNAIAPGITLPSADQTEAEFQRAQTLTPLGRGGSPDDLAAALRYLIAAEAVTGQTMIVDAGQHLFPAGRDLMFVERGEG